MQRPTLDKPRIELWKSDDEELAKFLDHIRRKALNATTWEFHNPQTNKMINYSVVAENIQAKFPPYTWIVVLRQTFLYLPEKMRLLREELFAIFKRLTLNAQERINYTKALEKYADHVEKALRKTEDTIAKFQEKNTDTKPKTDTHKAEIQEKAPEPEKPKETKPVKAPKQIPILEPKRDFIKPTAEAPAQSLNFD